MSKYAEITPLDNQNYALTLVRYFQEQEDIPLLLQRYYQELEKQINSEGIEFEYPLLSVNLHYGVSSESVYSHDVTTNMDFWGRISIQRKYELSELEIKKVEFITALLTPFLQSRIIQEASNFYTSADNLVALAKPELTEQCLTREAKIAFRKKRPISIILVDVDRFNNILESSGRLHSDKILYQIMQHIKSSIRGTDTLLRLNMGMFCIILSDVCGDQAIAISERLRKTIDRIEYADSHDKKLHLTLSSGIVELEETDSIKTVFKRARTALQFARNNGRNQSYLADALRVVA